MVSGWILGMLSAVLMISAVVLSIPCWVLTLECVFALFPLRRRPVWSGPRPKAHVLMPAHNEEWVIEDTVLATLPELGPEDQLLVIADNCSDRTTELAQNAGASVLVRTNPDQRGKGFALAYGLNHLATHPPEVVIILDADCRVTPGTLDHLARNALQEQRPVQADYLLVAPADASRLSRVSAFAFLVRNRVRARGLLRLGLPCQLMGSGMAFPWSVIAQASETEGNIVEDLAMGIDLALRGFPPLYTPWGSVTSLLPSSSPVARKQRRRWESGQLTTLLQFAPKLIWAGVRRQNLSLLSQGLDLLVPPLALFMGLLLVGCTLSTISYWWLGTSGIPPALFAINTSLVVTVLALVWVKYGRKILTFRDLLAIPAYLLWKVPLYFSLLVRGRERTWTRTEREKTDTS